MLTCLGLAKARRGSQLCCALKAVKSKKSRQRHNKTEQNRVPVLLDVQRLWQMSMHDNTVVEDHCGKHFNIFF